LDEQAAPRLHSNLHETDRTGITRNGESVVRDHRAERALNAEELGDRREQAERYT
jgi:hypothetical protein